MSDYSTLGPSSLDSSLASIAGSSPSDKVGHLQSATEHELYSDKGPIADRHEHPARTSSMGHASDIKRSIYLHRQRQLTMMTLRAMGGGRTMKRTHSAPGLADEDGNPSTLPKIVVGVCAVEKKARSKPMLAICKRLLAYGEFELLVFGDEVILNHPVEDWPLCDALLSWHSDGFPLKKAQHYAALRKPYLINDIVEQNVLLDRRYVYRRLLESGIPLPKHIIVNREDLPEGADPPGFEESQDYVSLDGVKITKPFVEKPADAEDHNIHIYYPHSMGGGVKRLFRKVENKSADYDPNHPGTVRRNGSFIYEEFLATGGTDVKVYTVGPRYAHAEARKSPVVDGKVVRSADGKELRFPVLLNPQEKEIARMVTLAFGQKVCGFDLLRSERNKSYVCDVNGLSFVKNSHKYYDDAAGILRSIILSAIAPHRLSLPTMPMPAFSMTPDQGLAGGELTEPEGGEGAVWEDSMDDLAMAAEDMELRCVLAVVRHGDRTPKQKMKMVVNQEPMLALLRKHIDSKGKQAKLKSPQELQELLDVTRQLLVDMEKQQHQHPGGKPAADASPGSTEGPAQKDVDLDEIREKLRIVKTVLEQGGQFAGINRKVQLKTLRWAPREEGSKEPPRIVEALLILKHGGVLTHAGRAQAEEFGRHFRTVMYPRYGPAGGGLLRLHSTYRHDLKIYSSDEGRVQMSAAAFTQGLLDLEGDSLTPILVSLVKKDAHMLDAFGKGASEDIRLAKQELYKQMTWDAATHSSAFAAPSMTTPLLSPPPSPKPEPANGSSESDGGGGEVQPKRANSHPPSALTSLGQSPETSPVLSSLPPAAAEGRRTASGPLTAGVAAQPAAGLPSGTPSLTAAAAEAAVARAAAAAAEETGASRPGSSDSADAGDGEHAIFHKPPVIAGMPSNPLALLKRLMEQIKRLVEGLRQKCLEEKHSPQAAESRPYSALTQSAREWELVPGQPCGGERLLLTFDRWRKLLKAFYNEKKKQFDISKVPDIYDSAKYDSIHNRELGLDLQALYETAKELANAVIPNEYGIDPAGKLRIGSKICSSLLGKILADLANMREESLATAHIDDVEEPSPFDEYPDAAADVSKLHLREEGSAERRRLVLRRGPGTGSSVALSEQTTAGEDESSPAMSAVSKSAPQMPTPFSNRGRGSEPSSARASGSREGSKDGNAAAQQSPTKKDAQPEGSSEDGDDDGPKELGPEDGASEEENDQEALHRLCPDYATEINSPLRHVRTRVYFTSESHMHSLINVLRFCTLGKEAGATGSAEGPLQGLVSPEAEERLQGTPELDYLTHIVMRLFENKRVAVTDPERFQVELQFSPGAAYDPFGLAPSQPHVFQIKPRFPLFQGDHGDVGRPTLADLEKLLQPMSAPAKASTYNFTMF